MKTNPLVSVCIPTYNNADFIGQTIESILAQTYKNIEILIGDNVSSDSTEEIINTFIKRDTRIKYFKNKKNLMYFGNCNNLIKKAKGKYIAIFHSDDVYNKDIIHKQVKFLEDNVKFAGVFSQRNLIDDNNNPIKCPLLDFELKNGGVIDVDLDFYISEMLVKDNYILVCPTSMVRRSVYIELGGYSEVDYIEDQTMWVKILENYKLAILNERLMSRRIHKNQGIVKSLERDKLSVHLQFYEEYFNRHPELKIKYGKYLKLRGAQDFNMLVMFYLRKKDFLKVKAMAKKSREIYLYSFFSMQGLRQRADNIALLFLIYLLDKVKGFR